MHIIQNIEVTHCLHVPLKETSWCCFFPISFYLVNSLSLSLYIYIYIYFFFFFKILLTLFLEEAMATHSSTLAWKIPWTEEAGRLQSMGSLRVGHDWGLHFHFLLSCIGEGNGNPLQCSCLENPGDGGAWWTAIYGVTQNRTWLKVLSGSSTLFWKETLKFRKREKEKRHLLSY